MSKRLILFILNDCTPFSCLHLQIQGCRNRNEFRLVYKEIQTCIQKTNCLLISVISTCEYNDMFISKSRFNICAILYYDRQSNRLYVAIVLSPDQTPLKEGVISMTVEMLLSVWTHVYKQNLTSGTNMFNKSLPGIILFVGLYVLEYPNFSGSRERNFGGWAWQLYILKTPLTLVSKKEIYIMVLSLSVKHWHVCSVCNSESVVGIGQR